ncbi:MAG TPA: sigma-54 dependent transcriptional regulator [Polyangiaceae bacterium]|nr:sigma-54 dependent transcriptional regulator [Polyangiaceae bacterium]
MPSIPPKQPRILVVDDEPSLRQTLSILLRREGFDVVLQPGFRGGVEAVRQSPTPFAVVLTDLVMPDGSGLDLLTNAKERAAATQVVVMTAHSTVEAAVDAMRRGAYDFITKPFANAEIAALISKALEKGQIVTENEQLRAKVRHLEKREMFGSGAAAKTLGDIVRKAASTRTTVLITGESGTGKELVARALHDQSERAGKPFLVVNCGALPEALMESELFGHEKGAFTGAQRSSLGLFREADGGTVLLDEVGELPASLQVKLLRVLQERKVRAVGGSAEVPVDVRVLAATNRDVESEVRGGNFRQDLYYRLNVIRIQVPALRERREDVAMLAERFVGRFSLELGKQVRGLEADAIRALEAYAYPGNIRELENMIERAVALASSTAIGLGDLPPEVSGLAGSQAPLLARLPQQGCELDNVLGEVERRLLLEALERTGGGRKAASKLLGISFRSLRYRLEKHALDLAGDDESEDEPPSSVEPTASPDVRGQGRD